MPLVMFLVPLGSLILVPLGPLILVLLGPLILVPLQILVGFSSADLFALALRVPNVRWSHYKILVLL